MAIEAVQHIRRMRGGAQSHLMRAADRHFYVVKFQNNPQHTKVLANELLATRLAQYVGLPAPATEIIEVKDDPFVAPSPPRFAQRERFGAECAEVLQVCIANNPAVAARAVDKPGMTFE